MDTTKIHDRIKRLLSLASSSNEHEAASAAAEAQRLMLQHGIETAQLNVADAPKAADSLTYNTGNMNLWIAVLANHVAKATFCMVFRPMGAGAGKSTQQITICGFPQDVAACSLLLTWLANEVNRFCEQQWAQIKSSGISANAWKKSFRLGAVQVIGERLFQDRSEAKKQQNSTALVHLSSYEKRSETAVSTLLASQGVRLKTGHASGPTNADGYTRGREAGAQINLNAPKRALA